MIVLVVKYFFEPGNRALFAAEVAENKIAELSRAEDGNRGYEYAVPEDGDEILLLYETWESREALAAHAASEHFALLQEIKSRLVKNVEIEKYLSYAL